MQDHPDDLGGVDSPGEWLWSDVVRRRAIDVRLKVNNGATNTALLVVVSAARRHNAANDSSPRNPSSTMRIFSSAPYCFRVTRRMS
jgi:hypothetical protein